MEFVVSEDEINQIISKRAYVESETAIDLISLAMEEKKLIKIEYTKVIKPMTVYRQIEPYKLTNKWRGDLLYGFDENDNTIKIFYISNISEIEVLDQMFNPQWLVENQLR